MMTASQFLLLPVLFQATSAANKPWAPHRHYQPAFISTASPSTLRAANGRSAADAAGIVALHASKSTITPKKKKKKDKKASTKKVGGGFGASPSPKKKQSKSKDAGMVYPDLEAQVLQTMVPGSNSEDPGGVLAEEMYDRLEEIYGLEKFNFGGEGAIFSSIGVDDASDAAEEKEEDDGSSLFDDLLSGGASSGSDSVLDSLLGSPASPSATLISLGDIVESSTESTRSSSSQAASFDLNSVPPFKKFRVLHTDPMVLAIDDFFTPEECDKYVEISIDSENNQQQPGDDEDQSSANDLRPMLLGKSRTVGKDSRSQAQRTSTTWFHHYAGVPELMAKASRLLGLANIDRWEEPQTVRYRRNEKFTWHLDALSPEEANEEKGAGQRVATLLVYLTEMEGEDGGATMFRDLGGDDGPLKVRPKKGSALIFFPSAGGIPNTPFDIRTLHCGEVVSENAENEKWITQLWLRERGYKPTAPAGNEHANASDAIGKYCDDCSE